MRLRVLLVFALSGLASARLTAQIAAIGSELQVNTYTTSAQAFPSIAADSAGNFIVVWSSNLQEGPFRNIYGQRYDASATPVGGEFPICTYTTDDQDYPVVAMDSTGNFVVAWQDVPGSGSSIHARRFDAAATPVGEEIVVSSVDDVDAGDPAIAMRPTGEFVVVWSSLNAGDGDGDNLGVFGQRFDASAAPAGTEFRVNTYTTGEQQRPAISINSSGDFVVVWESYLQDGDRRGVYAQRYDASGAAQGDETPVNATTVGMQDEAAVTIGEAGQFVVAWKAEQGDSSYAIATRLFDASGAPLGSEVLASEGTAIWGFPQIAGLSDGGFEVFWATDFEGPFARRFEAGGRAVGRPSSFRPLPGTGTGFPTAFVDSNGRGAATWMSGIDSDDWGVSLRRLDLMGPDHIAVDPIAGPSSNGNGIIEPGESFTVSPSWRNTAGASSDLSGVASNLTGPLAGPYSIEDPSAVYGTLAAAAVADCLDASGDCYSMTVGPTHTLGHWDVTFDESLSSGVTKTWTMHVGDSFPDVPVSHPFYAFVENLFHNGITGGCGAGGYCPDNAVTRGQMAVFLLKAEHGAAFVPTPCTGVFPDVACPSTFADWIEQLAAEGITGGCGGGNVLPRQPRHARADVRVPAEGRARRDVHTADLRRRFHRRRVSEPLRRLDRAPRGRGDHRRLRRW